MRGEHRGGDRVEALLRRVRRWLDSDAPTAAEHPDAAEFAALVDWLAQGAVGACPEPEAQAHAAACRTCYRKAEDLLLACTQAGREAARDAVGDLLVCLAREAGASYLSFVDAAGARVQRPLVHTAGEGRPLPLAGAVAESDPAPDPAAPAEPVDLPAGFGSISVEARPSRDRFDLLVTAFRKTTGESLPGLTIRLLNEAGEILREDTTDRRGCASFYALDPRRYRLEILT